jgi:hypothetical protein
VKAYKLSVVFIALRDLQFAKTEYPIISKFGILMFVRFMQLAKTLS